MERGIRNNRMRLKYLVNVWQKELDTYRLEMIKVCSKHKDSKAQKEKLVKPLTKLSAPRAFFKQLVYRCKVLHSLAFFQWRYMNVPGAHRTEIDEIFTSKVQYFKDSIAAVEVAAYEEVDSGKYEELKQE